MRPIFAAGEPHFLGEGGIRNISTLFFIYRPPAGQSFTHLACIISHYQRTYPEDLERVKSWFYKEYKMLVSMWDCESRDGGFRKTQNRRFW